MIWLSAHIKWHGLANIYPDIFGAAHALPRRIGDKTQRADNRTPIGTAEARAGFGAPFSAHDDSGSSGAFGSCAAQTLSPQDARP